jgi:phage terminase large subunit-like protein
MSPPRPGPPPLDFYSRLFWIDGRPLLDTMEPYRRDLLMRALWTFREDGTPLYNLVLSGRAKKNHKTTDLVLAGLYRLLMWASPAGNDGYILANDEEQAGDDLGLAKKLVAINPGTLGSEVKVLSKSLVRKDGGGSLRILPANDVTGAHGKTASFIGFDEIHGYRNHDIFEALAPDPTRADALIWITSYDTIYNAPGVPLYDYKARGLAGDDPRMLFDWYSGDLCTNPALADLPPEQRANPSMASWPEGPAYLEQQRRRLPNHKFRRLHLNLPGAPNGAFLDGDSVSDAIVRGLRRLPPSKDRQYAAFVDMSGGSSDDATLAIAHKEGERRILDVLISQDTNPPFDPRLAIRKFARTLDEYGIKTVTGDRYAGETFKHDFADYGITLKPSAHTKTDLYEAFEPLLNAGEVELLDLPKLQEQLLTLVVRGKNIDHQPGGHDDFANAAAGALVALSDDDGPNLSREDRERIYREHNSSKWGGGGDPLHGF